MTTHAAELVVRRGIVSTSSTSSTAVHGGFGIGLATVIVTVVLWCTMVNFESCNKCKNDIIYVSSLYKRKSISHCIPGYVKSQLHIGKNQLMVCFVLRTRI